MLEQNEAKEKVMITRVKSLIREVKDFPKPGIGFKDITPVIHDAESFSFVIERMISWAKKKKPQLIVGIESRGFLFASPVAHKLGLGLAIIRKKGKLPGRTVCVKAPNEYAVEYFEMHADCLDRGQRVLIIDDLIATGSSSVSAIDLVKKLGGKVVGFMVLVELSFLNGVDFIKKTHPDVDLFSLIKFEE
jgi:adenine phosphoribosyltransferase